jgi:peptidoglycan hydrolase-like protein with peptidoglycan-binding domain
MSSESGEELHHKARPRAESVRNDFKHPTNGELPLPDSDRRFFDSRFGWDFSKVRIYTDGEASIAARSVNALAYTMGNDIVFGEGQYRPGTEDGRRLLAHELAHTIQQTGDRAPEIRRKIGDGHDLTASRFAGDSVLEAIYDNERVLKSGDKGEAVKKLQQALLEAGYSLPRFGVDGIFGPETAAAVMDFQRASGLGTGGVMKGIDGVVDATTMGWLDQRFSAGPTPPGKTPGATPGCSTFKTVSVDLVTLDESARGASSVQDLDRANSIFNQCCVRFALSGGGSESPDRTRALLGGDTVLHMNPRMGSPTTEEITMFNGATADFNLSGRIRAFYVNSLTPSSTPSGDTDAYSIPPSAATGFRATLRNMVVITDKGSVRALAHEFGHILLDQGNNAHYGVDGNFLGPEYLMSPAGSTPGERITPNQRRTIFDNA